jgi:hypothetical protein
MSILSAIGGLVGMAMGGPAGAAIGSGLGRVADGGNLEDAFKSAAMSFAGGGAGPMGGIMNAMGGGGGGGNQMSQLASMLGGGGGGGGNSRNSGIAQIMQAMGAAGSNGQGGGGNQGGGNQGGGGIGGIGSMMNNPAVMAALLRASEPESIKMTSALQDAQLATGERMPNYRGIGIRESRPGMPSRPRQFTNRPTYAQGGLIEGPGTGTSDSIPGMIQQNGKPVEEILVSNNEFILREKDVKKIGDGDRNLGAARLYAMQRGFDKGGRV